jgi:hypothetical protein
MAGNVEAVKHVLLVPGLGKEAYTKFSPLRGDLSVRGIETSVCVPRRGVDVYIKSEGYAVNEAVRSLVEERENQGREIEVIPVGDDWGGLAVWSIANFGLVNKVVTISSKINPDPTRRFRTSMSEEAYRAWHAQPLRRGVTLLALYPARGDAEVLPTEATFSGEPNVRNVVYPMEVDGHEDGILRILNDWEMRQSIVSFVES